MNDREIIHHLQHALAKVMAGGNHLASNLIGQLGAGDGFPVHSTPHEQVMHALEKTPDHTVTWMNEYEQWCCWNAIMDARDIARNALAGYDGSVLGVFEE